MFAFEYIMTEGLTGWYDYPYREQSGARCTRYQYTPRASLQGYLIISAMNQVLWLATKHVCVCVCVLL